MSIAETIQRLRREKNLTQQQLAGYLGITSRAVSQWECGRTAPDLSQIPALCHVFGVSSDTLLGIDGEKNEETIRALLAEAEEVGNRGDFVRRTELLREALHRFPRSYAIMTRLADAIVCENCRKGVKNYDEPIALCRRILDECTDSRLRYDAVETLGCAYGYAGKTAEMRALAAEMPRLWDAYEDFMTYRWKGDADFAERQECLAYMIYHLIDQIGPLSGHTHDDGSLVCSAEERMELWKLQIHLLEAIFPDGDYQYGAQLGEIACRLLASAYLTQGDGESAWHYAEKCADFAMHMDTYDFNAPHTSPILRGRIDGGWIRENGEGRCDGVLDWLENDGKTEPLRRDPRYPALIARLRIAAENE